MTPTIAVCLWKWGSLFSVLYVNRMQSMLARNLRLNHRIYCFTDNADGIDRDVICLPIPRDLSNLPRCRRRMWQYNRIVDGTLGRRLLSIDLDVVITDDITPLVNRPEPIVMWRVGYANVLSGSFVLWDAGALDGAWAAFDADREGYPRRAQPLGTGSDQAMINLWACESRTPIAELTERDGMVTWFGDGYAKREHLGMGPGWPHLLPGARVVVLGSADKRVMDRGEHAFVREHWR